MLLQTPHAHLKGKSVKVNGNTYPIDNNCCVSVENEADINKLLVVGYTDEPVVRKGRAPRKITTAVPAATYENARAFVDTVAANPRLQERAEKAETFRELLKFGNEQGYNFTKPQLDRARKAYLAREAPVRPAEASPDALRKLAVDPDAVAEKRAEDARKQAERDERLPADDGVIDTPFGRYKPSLLTDVSTKLGLPERDLLLTASQLDQESGGAGVLDAAVFQKAAASLLPEGALDPEVDPSTPVDPEGNELEEWPDPTEEMDLSYLKKIADAYEVSYAPNIGAKKLVERVTAAMYPEGSPES